jgi:hypothetical protein
MRQSMTRCVRFTHRRLPVSNRALPNGVAAQDKFRITYAKPRADAMCALPYSARMKAKPAVKIASRKLGVEAHDPAARPRRLDRNFSQSKDIHEDRGTVQSQMGRRKQGPRK